ncbi:hypothetical protein D1872_277280 [compost metagenome]
MSLAGTKPPLETATTMSGLNPLSLTLKARPLLQSTISSQDTILTGTRAIASLTVG